MFLRALIVVLEAENSSGDYNLVALDYISKAGLTWVGNCNELNAGT